MCCKIKLTPEKETRNTVRFTEVLEGKLTNPVIGTLYVPKETLKSMGWADGDDIAVDIEAIGKPQKTAKRTTAAAKTAAARESVKATAAKKTAKKTTAKRGPGRPKKTS